jgi:EAL domain-containing protein (putative c-di-GMP-specific phosphodiesterase class I)
MARSFIDDVKEILEEEALHPSYLVLEVTEGTLMSDTEAAIERLGQLRSNGVRLAVDDFGTGYSSLGYLRRFPLDIIKIDRSFIEGIERDEEGAALVKGIISMAEALRLGVVAEGIETIEQLQCLRRLGCTEGQGFYIARPLDPEVLELLLQKEALGQPLKEAFHTVS